MRISATMSTREGSSTLVGFLMSEEGPDENRHLSVVKSLLSDFSEVNN